MWKDAEKFLRKDKYIGPLIKKHGPCKLKPRKESEYFENLVDSIVSQQLSVKAAATIYGRLVEKAGGEITPDIILKLGKTSIRSCGLSNAKCDYVKDLANKVKSNELELDRLKDFTDEKVTKELVAVKGIGKWTAEMFLMFSLARPDVFSEDDIGLLRGVEKMFKKNLTRQNVGVIAVRWKPYRTTAAWYVWKSLDNK